jgi:hypothetical protein
MGMKRGRTPEKWNIKRPPYLSLNVVYSYDSGNEAFTNTMLTINRYI